LSDKEFNPAQCGLLPHGGQLQLAAEQFAIPIGQWLDLSTGINPNGWPIVDLPPNIWSRLPEYNDGLEIAAQNYYQVKNLLVTAGSQAVIQTLPRLRSACRVAIIEPSYNEHAYAWRSAGHQVQLVSIDHVEQALVDSDVLVVVRPNNPSGDCIPCHQIMDWHAHLARRQGWLLVDEAFIDPTPEQSLTPSSDTDGLIVLRSLGKFFGLAGARIGFAFAQPVLLQELHRILGPWTVATPARLIAKHALQDRGWQQQCQQQLIKNSQRLQQILTQYKLPPDGGCALFQWCISENAAQIHQHLANLGILTRLFDKPNSLRFGLPGKACEWNRLEIALRCLDEQGHINNLHPEC